MTTIETLAETELHALTPYLEHASISAQNTGIAPTVEWLTAKFEALGGTVTVWPTAGNPVVFADFAGAGEKTILFYNHYDVQPPEPLAEWHSEPFTPTFKDGKLFARGIADDKGDLMSRLVMLQWFNDNGGLPCHVKFMVEGEEEIGSPHIAEALNDHREALAADVCVWEGGGRDEADKFTITCGVKGVTTIELAVTTAAVDLHSSLAAVADSAVWRLVQALASMKDPAGQITVAGFSDNIQPLSASEQAAVARMSFDAAAVTANYGLTRPLVTADPNLALVNGTTMTINGISGGYEGAGVKTIVPQSAFAKIDCRLVPGQTPTAINDAIRAHLDSHGFSDVQLTPLNGMLPYRTPVDDPFIQLNAKIANAQFGAADVRVIPNMAGSGPAAAFGQALGDLPIVMFGVHYAGSHPHSPNENIRVADFVNATRYLVDLMTAFGAE